MPNCVLHGRLDRNRYIAAAEIFGEPSGEALRRLRIVDAGHIDKQQVFGRQYPCIEGGGHSGVDAAGNADDDAFHADGFQEQPNAVGERAEDVRGLRFVGNRSRLSIGERFEVKNLRRFLIRFAGKTKDAPRVVGGVRAVEGVDGLAVVLDPDVVHVEKRRARFGGKEGKDAAALGVLAEGVRRRGDVDEKVRSLLFTKDFHRRKPVVVAPAVLAKQAADGIRPAAYGKAHGRDQILRRGVKLTGQLLQAEKMARVVELPIVRHQRLDDERIGRGVGRDELPVLRGEERVVLSDAAVVVLLRPIDGDVAEHYRNTLRRRDDFLAAGFAFFEKSRLFPGVAQKIAGNRHFGKNDEVGVLLPRIGNIFEHRIGVVVGTAGDDAHLSKGDLKHGKAFFHKDVIL